MVMVIIKRNYVIVISGACCISYIAMEHVLLLPNFIFIAKSCWTENYHLCGSTTGWKLMCAVWVSNSLCNNNNNNNNNNNLMQGVNIWHIATTVERTSLLVNSLYIQDTIRKQLPSPIRDILQRIKPYCQCA